MEYSKYTDEDKARYFGEVPKANFDLLHRTKTTNERNTLISWTWWTGGIAQLGSKIYSDKIRTPFSLIASRYRQHSWVYQKLWGDHEGFLRTQNDNQYYIRHWMRKEGVSQSGLIYTSRSSCSPFPPKPCIYAARTCRRTERTFRSTHLDVIVLLSSKKGLKTPLFWI